MKLFFITSGLIIGMVSIIKSQNNPSNPVLPEEVMSIVYDFADICSYVFKTTCNGVEMYDFNTMKKVREIRTLWLFEMSVSPCGTFVVGSNEHSRVHIWNMLTGELVEKIELRTGFEETPRHLFTPEGELLVACKNFINSFKYSPETKTFQWTRETRIPEEDGIITRICYNNGLLACGTNTGNIYIFNSSKTLVRTITDFSTDEYREINSIDIKNNKLVASTWGKKNVCFDLKTNLKAVFEKPKFGNHRTPFIVDNLLITPCGTKVIGSYDCATFMWDFSTGKIVRKLAIKPHSVRTFSPGGSKLITSSRDEKIEVIDWRSL